MKSPIGQRAHEGAVIAARGLTRRFADFVAVDAVDLDVRRGEVFGLLGANGAGKTTIIRMLCGLLKPSAGEIEVAGIDMRQHPRDARGRIGYVAQGFALYGDLSVAENLALQAGLYGLTGQPSRTRQRWALAHLELTEVERRPARTLPLGFQRRLSLAAALLHEPQVLFLDEPTSGVDPLARQLFWELIYDLAETGIGILVTTHYMDETMFCDRLALMHAGKIVEQGTPQSLLERQLARPVLELQAVDSGHCASLLAALPEIEEIVPHAGRLRLQLRPRIDPDIATRRIRQLAREHRLEVSGLKPVAPDLEDVFVSVLARASEEAGP